MATLFPDIKSRDWQISIAGIGAIAEGLADIRQCLDILLRTSKGSDPLRPQFGSDIFQYVDQPMNRAIPNIIRAIIEAVQIWEKRVVVKEIKYDIPEDDISNARFYITYQLVDQELIDLLILNLAGGFDTGLSGDTSLILQAFYPPNPNNKRYTISFIADENQVLPNPPVTGFLTLNDLYNWVVTNWSGYGRWLQAADRIILYTNPGLFQTASIAISVVGKLRFEAEVPNLFIGEDYGLTFIPDGSPAVPSPPASFESLGELYSWVNANWGSYGEWFVETNTNAPADFLAGDFDSEDFDTGVPATYTLVLYSETVNAATLTVTAV